MCSTLLRKSASADAGRVRSALSPGGVNAAVAAAPCAVAGVGVCPPPTFAPRDACHATASSSALVATRAARIAARRWLTSAPISTLRLYHALTACCHARLHLLPPYAGARRSPRSPIPLSRAGSTGFCTAARWAWPAVLQLARGGPLSIAAWP